MADERDPTRPGRFTQGGGASASPSPDTRLFDDLISDDDPSETTGGLFDARWDKHDLSQSSPLLEVPPLKGEPFDYSHVRGKAGAPGALKKGTPEQVAAPSRPIRAPLYRSRSPTYRWFRLLFHLAMLVALVAAGAWVFQRRVLGDDAPHWSADFPGAPPRAPFHLRGLTSTLVETQQGRFFLVVSGFLEPGAEGAGARVQVELSHRGTVLTTAEARAGQTLSPEWLHTLSTPQDLQRLFEKMEESGEMDLFDNRVPFWVVLEEPPSDMSEVQIRVSTVKEAAAAAVGDTREG